MANSTRRCFARDAPENSPPLFQHGNLVFQAHHVGWLVTGFFMAVSTITSIWLVNKHLQWYTNKREQRYIIRLLFLVPIYATVSLASYLFWDHATALILVRDCYESIVLTAFFYLLLVYLSPNPDEQKAIFIKRGLSKQADREARRKGRKPTGWVFPLGFVKSKPEDGLYFLQFMKWGVLQYCVIRPITTLVAVLLNYFGLYCDISLSPVWGHVYIVVIVSVSVSVAMYCLIQLYVSVAKELAPHKPLLKLFAVKAVVFLTFWQATGLGILSLLGVVKDTKYMTADEINIGIAAILETFEMMLFAFLHVKAFTYKPYRPQTLPGEPLPQRTNRLKSLGHAFDFRETFREIWAGWIYIVDRTNGREPRPDKGVRRVAHMEKAFGRIRPGFEVEMEVDGEKENELADRDGEPGKVVMEGEVEEDVGARIWGGVSSGDGYSLGYGNRREKSEAFGVQVEKELKKRGYELGISGRLSAQIEDLETGHQHKPQKSWWRNMYDRISQAGPDPEDEPLTRAPSRRKSRSRSMYRSTSRHHSRNHRSKHDSRNMDVASLLHDHEYEDPPPASVIKTHRGNKRQRESGGGESSDADVLAPLHVFDQPQLRRSRQFPPAVQRNQPSVPQSIHGPSLAVPMAQVTRNDSLLARVFPSSIASSSDHGSESPTSGKPMHGISRPRLMPPIPVVVSQVMAYRPESSIYDHNIIEDAHPLPPLPEVVVHGVDYDEPPPKPTLGRPSTHDSNTPPPPQSLETEPAEVSRSPSPQPIPLHRRESAQARPLSPPQISPQRQMDPRDVQPSPQRAESPRRRDFVHAAKPSQNSPYIPQNTVAGSIHPPLHNPHRTQSGQSSPHGKVSMPLNEPAFDAQPVTQRGHGVNDVESPLAQSARIGDAPSNLFHAPRKPPPPLFPTSSMPPFLPMTQSPAQFRTEGLPNRNSAEGPSLRRGSGLASSSYIPPPRRTQKRSSTAPMLSSASAVPGNYQSSLPHGRRAHQLHSDRRSSGLKENSTRHPVQMPILSHNRPNHQARHSMNNINTTVGLLPTHHISPSNSPRKFTPLSAAPPSSNAATVAPQRTRRSTDLSGLPIPVIPAVLDESTSLFLRETESRYPSPEVINASRADRPSGHDIRASHPSSLRRPLS